MQQFMECVREWAHREGVLPLPVRTARFDSREVSFSAALAWAQPHLRKYTDLPTFGTPAWRDETDQRRKTASAVNAALMWALHAENRGTAEVDALQEVSDALDWRAESKHIGYRESPSHIKRPKRGAA